MHLVRRSSAMYTTLQIINKTDGDGGNVEAKRKYIHIRPPELFMHEEEQVILSPSESRIADILSDPNYPLGLQSTRQYFKREKYTKRKISRQHENLRVSGVRLSKPNMASALTHESVDYADEMLLQNKRIENLAFERKVHTKRIKSSKRSNQSITSLKLGKKSSIFLPHQVTTTKASKRQKTPDSTRSITLVRQLTDMEDDNTHLVMDPDSSLTSVKSLKVGTKRSKKGKTDQQSIRPSVISQSDTDEEQQPSQPAATADTDRDKPELKSHRSVRKISYPTDSRGQVALQPKKRSRRHTMVDISTLSAFSTLTDLKSPMAKPSLTSTKEEVIVQSPLEVIPETPVLVKKTSIKVDTEKPVRKLAKMKNVALAATKLREPQRKVKNKKPEAGQQKPEVKVDEESVSSMDSDNLQSMWNMLVSENPEKSARRISPDQQLDPSLVPGIEMSTLSFNEEELIRHRKEEIKKYWRKIYTQATQLAKTSETALTDQLAPGTKGRWDDFYIANEDLSSASSDEKKRYYYMAVNTTKYISNLAKQSAEERKASAMKGEGSIVIRSKSIDAEAAEMQVSRPKHGLTVQPKKMRKLSGSSERQRAGSVTAQLDSETKTARRKSSKKEDKVYKHSLGKGHDKRASRPVTSQKGAVDEVERQTDAERMPSRDDLQAAPSEDDLLEVLGWKDLQRVASRKELQRVSSRKDVHRVLSRKDMQRVSSRKELKIASSEKDLKREPSPMEIKPKEETHKVTGRAKSKTSASDFVSGPKMERRSTSYDLERASPEHGVSPRLPYDQQQGAKKPKDREMDRIVLSLQSKAASDTVLHRSSSGIELVRSKSDSKVSFEEGAEAKWRLDEKRLRFHGHRNPFTIHWTESATDLTDFIGPASFLKEIQAMKGAAQTARKKILPSIGAQDKDRDLDIDLHVQKDTDVGLSEVRDRSTTRGGKETIPHKHAVDSSKKQPAKKISSEKALATDVPSSERVHAKSSEEVELSKKKSLSKRVHSSPSSKTAFDDRDLLAELEDEKIQLRKKFAKKMRDKTESEQSLMHAELMKKIAEVTELSKKRARELGKVRRSESMLSLHEDKKATLLREDFAGPLGALPAEEDETDEDEEDSTAASPLSSSEQVAESEGSAPPPPKHQKHRAAIKKHAGHGSETRLAEAKKADRTSATKVKGLSPVTMSDTNIMKRAKSPETLPVRSHKSLMALGASRDKITPQFEQVQRKSPSDLEDWLQRHFSDKTPEELSHEVHGKVDTAPIVTRPASKKEFTVKKFGSKDVLPPIVKRELSRGSSSSATSVTTATTHDTTATTSTKTPTDLSAFRPAPTSGPSYMSHRGRMASGASSEHVRMTRLRSLKALKEERSIARAQFLRTIAATTPTISRLITPMQARVRRKFRGWDLDEPLQSQPMDHVPQFIETVPTLLKALTDSKKMTQERLDLPNDFSSTTRHMVSPADQGLAYNAYHGIEELFEFLLTNVIQQRPPDPLDFLIDLTRQIIHQMNLRYAMSFLLNSQKKQSTPLFHVLSASNQMSLSSAGTMQDSELPSLVAAPAIDIDTAAES